MQPAIYGYVAVGGVGHAAAADLVQLVGGAHRAVLGRQIIGNVITLGRRLILSDGSERV